MATEENRIVRLPEVMRLTGQGRAAIDRRHRDGTFAKSLRLGSQSTGWRNVEILEWLESLGRAGAVLDDGGRTSLCVTDWPGEGRNNEAGRS